MRLGLGTPRVPAFIPTKLAGCVLWLRADVVSLVSTDHVTAWGNRSSGPATVAQATDANRPTYIPNDVGSLPGIRGAATRWLDVSSMATPTAMSLFVVMKRSSLSANYFLAGNSGQLGIIQNFSGSALEWFNGGGTDRLSFAVSPTAGAHILGVTQTNGGALTIYYDGAQADAKGTAGANLVALDCLFNTATHSNGTDGDILEVIVYSRVLSAAQISRVHRYLASRYGVSL